LKQNQKVDGKKLDERKGIFAPRKVINLLNNKIYESCSEAGRCLDVKSSTITFRCKSKKSFVFYYDDYILMSTQEKLDLINNIKGNIDYKEVANY
jgi:hypothetical protein